MSTETAVETSQQPVDLACPECGTQKFSWILEQVQFGYPYRDSQGNVIEEGAKMGEVVGDDIDRCGLFCTSCHEHFDRDELVEVEQ